MQSDEEIIRVVSAHKEGKKIEVGIDYDLEGNVRTWSEIVNPQWNFKDYTYRAALEPRKPREWILHIPDEVLCSKREDKASIYHTTSPGHSGGYVDGAQCVRVREVLE